MKISRSLLESALTKIEMIVKDFPYAHREAQKQVDVVGELMENYARTLERTLILKEGL